VLPSVLPARGKRAGGVVGVALVADGRSAVEQQVKRSRCRSDFILRNTKGTGSMSQAYLIGGARTPIGSFLGSFVNVPAPELGAVAIKAAVERSGLGFEQFDEVIMGNVVAAGVGQAPARQAALRAGFPSSIPCLTINKVCGSGLKAVMLASQAIRCGDARAIVAGGMENMSAAPHFVAGMRTGIKLGEVKMQDAMVHDGLTCSFENCHMGNHAEHIARRFGVSRADQDAFAARSQQRAGAAIAAGWFAEEIAPVTIVERKGSRVVALDEGTRPETTVEGLGGLKPVFDKLGTVTAGNASTLSDGAAAVVVVDESLAEPVKRKFRILASHTSGTDPRDLFIAPVEAIRGALQKAQLELAQVDLFEINEAFASQMVACCRELSLDEAKVNIAGGGISLGHPIGASGARVLVSLMHLLSRQGQRYGVASLCLGGGNAVAMVIEAI
jgi:acetyl-CoA C-acetyltransferase